MAQRHHLAATPQNLFWGYFDAATPPVLEVESGDEVDVDCLPASTAADLPPGGAGVLPEHLEALSALLPDKGPSPHIMTGPIAVRGARPGDMLQVDILEVRPIQNWGYVSVLPLLGALPEDFDRGHRIHVGIDAEAGLARMPFGKDLPLDPFFGVMAVAPPAHWGRVGAAQPRAFGGNMDNRELRAGTTLYIPVHVDGALFSVGDGHGLQGDGEVCLSAVETALAGRFRLTLRRDITAALPFAETPDRLISMGFATDLDSAMRAALRAMIAIVSRRTGLEPIETYMLLSLVGNLRITQVVDGEKGVHMIVDKTHLPDRPAEEDRERRPET